MRSRQLYVWLHFLHRTKTNSNNQCTVPARITRKNSGRSSGGRLWLAFHAKALRQHTYPINSHSSIKKNNSVVISWVSSAQIPAESLLLFVFSGDEAWSTISCSYLLSTTTRFRYIRTPSSFPFFLLSRQIGCGFPSFLFPFLPLIRERISSIGPSKYYRIHRGKGFEGRN